MRSGLCELLQLLLNIVNNDTVLQVMHDFLTAEISVF